MAHEVEQMAYTGEVPWHGLGTPVSADISLEDMQKAAGLDWTVSKRPVLYHGGDSNKLTFKDKFVLTRDTDNTPYAVVSGRYKPVQPKEILEFFRTLIADFNMTIETAGSLRDGKRVWALAKTGEAHKVMGVDKVDGYLMLATSYDLTFSTLAQFTSVRVVCNNTLQQSFGQHSGRVSIPHFRDFKMEDVKNELGVGFDAWAAYTAMLDTLAAIKIHEEQAHVIVRKIFKVDPLIVSPENAVNIQHTTKVMELFESTATGRDIAGDTGWGLVNAVTQYLDQFKRARSQANRLDSAWFGDSFNIKKRAVDAVLAEAPKETTA